MTQLKKGDVVIEDESVDEDSVAAVATPELRSMLCARRAGPSFASAVVVEGKGGLPLLINR